MSLPAPVSWTKVAPKSLHKTTALAGTAQQAMAATINENIRLRRSPRISHSLPGPELLHSLFRLGGLGWIQFLLNGFPEVSALVIAVRGPEGKPLGSFHQILRHSLPERVGDSQVILRPAISPLRRFAIPLGGLNVILRHAPPLLIHHAQ